MAAQRAWVKPAQGTAIIVAVSLAITGAVIADGFETEQAVLSDGTVWVVNQSEQAYGQVNTVIGELASIALRDQESPLTVADVLQTNTEVLVRSSGKFARVDRSQPQSFTSEQGEALPLDANLIDVAGPYLSLLNTETRELVGASITQVVGGTVGDAVNQGAGVVGDGDANADEQHRDQRGEGFLAATVTPDGVLYGYSDLGQLVSVDIETGRVLDRRDVPGPDVSELGDVAAVQLTVFGDSWALLGGGAGEFQLWVDGQLQQDVPFAESAVAPKLAEASDERDALYIGYDGGLLTYRDGSLETVAEVVVGSTPAKPVVHNGCVYAAWMLMTRTVVVTECGESLDTYNDSLPASRGVEVPNLVFRTDGEFLVLNESATGVVWQRTDDDWQLVTSSLTWTQQEVEDQHSESDEQQQATENRCPVPATGRFSEFGARSAALTTLPVLLGATDANPQDVISIIPGTVEWVGDGLGSLHLVNSNQEIVFRPDDQAEGTATVRFMMTDGTARCEEEAEATVTIRADDENSPPIWVDVRDQPTLAVAPGSTVSWNALEGWMDPDGDPFFLESATLAESDPYSNLVSTPDGSLIYKPDGEMGDERVLVQQRVSDGREGGTASGVVEVDVLAAPTLQTTPFVTTVSQDERLTIDLHAAVSGATGAVQLTQASVSDQDRGKLELILNRSNASLEVIGREPGRYSVEYEVASGDQVGTGSFRVEVFAQGERELRTSPITVFLRPNEDVTINPLDAVVNPAGGVLMVRDVFGNEGDAGVAPKAEPVSARLLRVSGNTRTGEPGRIGSFQYTVTDGVSSVVGQATVYQLPEQVSVTPVAVDDQVTLRPGSQVDIPVLDNDLSPDGGTLVLDPRFYTDDSARGLAFPSNSTLRYLAPNEPGAYEIDYRIYTAGAPESYAKGRVFVTVTGGTENAAPQPRNLESRVTAWGTTTVEVPSFGVDPDGDTVVVTAVSPPEAGNGQAEVAANGTSIIVRSSGEAGPIDFEYTVSDGFGGEATARVRVGVLDSVVETLVAFNDYRETQEGREILIDPTLNDSVPETDTVRVVAVVPSTPVLASGDANSDSAVRSEDQAVVPAELPLTGNTVRITPEGTGKHVYRYTVESSGGSRADGFIVLNVVSESVPEYPVVSDTEITSSHIDGDRFSANVVENRVIWNGSPMTLALRGDPAGIDTPVGHVVAGSLTDQYRIIAFSLTASTETNGDEPIRSFGFVRVPAQTSIRPELVDPARFYEVNEGASVEVNLGRAVRVLTGRTLEVHGAAVTGKRASARCSVSSNTLTYSAGEGSTVQADGCLVDVQWAGEDDTRTQLFVNVSIILDDPPPTLRSAHIGDFEPMTTGRFDLATITDWAANDLSDLQYSCSLRTTNVTVRCEGGVVSVVVDRAATMGATESFPVTITNAGFEPQPTAVLTVGVATMPPSVLRPVSLTSEATESRSGVATVTLAATRPNRAISPYDDEPRVVEASVSGDSSSGVTVTAESDELTVTITQGTPGGIKRGSYRVEDIHGNTGVGQWQVTYNALPNRPDSVALETYSANSVTLSVVEGIASVPAVTGFEIAYSGGSNSCAMTGSSATSCVITGLSPNEAKTFTVAAVNQTGASRETVSTTGHAYSPASDLSVTWVPVNTADGRGERARLSLAGDANTKSFRVAVSGSDQTYTPAANANGRATQVIAVTNTGAHTVTVTADDRLGPPAAKTAPQQAKGSASAGGVHGVGRPLDTSIAAVNTDGTITVTASATANGGEVRYYIAQGATASCSGSSAETATFSSLALYTAYEFAVCAESRYNGESFGSSQEKTRAATFREPTWTASTFDVEQAPDSGGLYALIQPSASSFPYEGGEFFLKRSGLQGASTGVPVQATEQACIIIGSEEFCSAEVKQLTPADTSRSYPARVRDAGWSPPESCVAGEPLPTVSVPDGVVEASSGDYTAVITRDYDPVSLSATYRLTVDWQSRLVGLTDYVGAPEVVQCTATESAP